MAYFHHNKEDVDSCDEFIDPKSSSRAGMKNLARNAQPSMYHLLSWGDEGAKSTSAQPQPTPPAPKQIVENRWQTESQYQFCQVGNNKNKKSTSKRSTSVPERAAAESVEQSQPPAYTTSETKAETDTFEGAHSKHAKARSKCTQSSSINWKPVKTVAKKQRQLRTAKKRCELDSLMSSRGVPDSSLAEVYERPAFHNYGRASLVNPWVPKEGLQTCNARKVKAISIADISAPTEVTQQRATSPGPRSPSPLKNTRSQQKSSPQKIVSKQPVQSSSPRASPRASSPPLMLDVPTPAPSSPSVLPSQPPAALSVKSMGNANHVRAARIVAPPSKALPASLAKLSANQVNDPKRYRCLPPDWTGIIKPAGTPNPKSESVNDCLHLFD